MNRTVSWSICLAIMLVITACGEGTATPQAPPVPAASNPAASSALAPPTAPPPGPIQTPAAKASHVVILVIDGPRWSETFGEPTKQYIPHLAKELAPQGAVWSDFSNDGPTLTTPGHTAIITGFHQEIENGGRERPAHPSMLQMMVRDGGSDALAWLITSKDKLAVLNNCTDPAWKDQWLCRSDCGTGGKGLGAGYREDAETMQRVLEILPMDHPRLVLINLKQPDAAGHSKDWAGYLKGIQAGDASAKALWDMLQQDPVYRGTTDLFITNDHGRHLDGHKDGFVSHGDDCAGCRKIMLVALGPDAPAGAVFAAHRNQIDLAATTAHILGLRLVGSTGKVMDELWTGSAR